MLWSKSGLRDDSAGLDRVGQLVVVALVLRGVGLGELEDRAVKRAAATEVGRDRYAVAAARMCARQRPTAQSAVMPSGIICSISAEAFQSFSWRR
jgi:hypothetical protein